MREALGPVTVFAIVAGLLVGAGSLPTIADSTAVPPASVRAVRVVKADTLWSIAAANPVPGLSVAHRVADIRRLNGFDGASVLKPGTVIRVPAAESDDSRLALK